MLWRCSALLSRLHELIKAKNILILGFGREGRSTLNRILEVGDAASITIADGNEALTLPAAMEITTLSGEKKSVSTEGINILTGAHYMDSLEDYDVVFKSPGVVLPKAADEYTCLTDHRDHRYQRKEYHLYPALSYFARKRYGHGPCR